MSPRISSTEAMTHPLSKNPFKRRWEAMQLIEEALVETPENFTIRASGFVGRAALVQVLQAIEIAEITGSMDHVERGDYSHVSALEESEN
jgi:hypothetical protein